MNNKKTALIIMGFALSAGIGAGGVYLANKDKIEFANRYPLFFEVEEFMIDTAEVGIPENPSDEDVINAYLLLYGDKYTFYKETDMTSEDAVVDIVNNSPTALGCGFEIDFDKEDKLYFSKVEEGMPADKQGIKVNDRIISIDGVEVTEFEHAKELRGKEGTTVKLLLERNGEKPELELTRYSDSLQQIDISYEKIGDILYVDYNRVGYSSANAVMEIFEENSFESLILDLRNNPGGQTTEAVNVADLFVDKADITYKYKKGTESILSTNDGVECDVHIVVLVNEKTASAAEILTSLLSQYADATTVGTTTLGKGIFQTIAMFKGNNLQYTSGYFTVGDWECWHGKGIDPDVEVKMDIELVDSDEDIQLEKAIELLSE